MEPTEHDDIDDFANGFTTWVASLPAEQQRLALTLVAGAVRGDPDVQGYLSVDLPSFGDLMKSFPAQPESPPPSVPTPTIPGSGSGGGGGTGGGGGGAGDVLNKIVSEYLRKTAPPMK